MIPVKWSYSSLELYKQCPHKYYRLKVVKDIVEPPTDATRFGTDVHKAAEDYIGSGVPIPEKYAFIKPVMAVVERLKGTHYVEYKMGLTRDLEPCDFYAKDVWWRGIADFLAVDGEKARLIDYKTGKSAKYADTKQLDILSLAVFKHFPEVKKVKAGLAFVVADAFIKAEFDADSAGVMWQRWLADTARLEKAVELDVWNCKPNFTCRGWCPVMDCNHWQPKKGY